MSIQFQRILFGLLILLPGASITHTFTHTFSVLGVPSPQDSYKTDIWQIESTPVRTPSAIPNPSQVVILPVVKQDGDRSLSSQDVQAQTITPQTTEIPTPPLTPQLIPPQNTSTNFSIVFGAMLIVVVIVITWFFISQRELKTSQVRN